MFSWPDDSVVQSFGKVVFCPVHLNANLALVGQPCRVSVRVSIRVSMLGLELVLGLGLVC